MLLILDAFMSFEKFFISAIIGYIGASLLSPRGYALFPSDEIGAARELLVGGGSPIPPHISHSSGSPGGGGSMHPNKSNWQRYYASDASGFPISPEENMASGPHYSICSPQALDCGMSLSCGYHKTMCALGLWK